MQIDGQKPVLIVDSYKAMVVAIRNMMIQMGYQHVIDAPDGSRALQVLREYDGKIGLIISESDLEPMSGLQLLREVRADDRMKDIPFLMTTATPSVETIVGAKKSGVSSIIAKPFSTKDLKMRVLSVMTNAVAAKIAS